MQPLYYFGILVQALILVECSQLFPKNKQTIYSWEANIQVGSVLPEPVLSRWKVKANVIIQNIDDAIIFKLSNVSINEPNKTILDPLLLPFQVVYEDGELRTISVKVEDVLWSINIKRALAALFQLKLSKLNSTAFSTQEVGIYGICNVEYIVFDHQDTTKIKTVLKNLDMQSCWGYTAQRWSSSTAFNCPTKYQNEISGHSERIYTVQFDDSAIIQNISTRGVIVLQPYQAQAEALDSLISQTMALQQIEPIVEEFTLDGDTKLCDIFFEEQYPDKIDDNIVTDNSLVILEIKNMLEELSESLWWEVGIKDLNNATVFHIINEMRSLQLQDWEELYDLLTLGTSYQQETMQHFFWEIVPDVGSEASVLFIRDLVKTRRVKGFLANRLLMSFPFKTHFPSEKLLAQCEELLSLDLDVDLEVRNTAILSFATLIQQTCAVQCKVDTLDRYAKLYLDRFTDNLDHEQRMLYLQGFSNMNIGQALDYLKPVITSQATRDRHIRFLAILACSNTAYTDHNKVFEIFWPILNNHSEYLELRVASLNLLMTTNPTPARLISLFWYMKSEPSQQLYNFYYTTVKSLSETTHPCFSQLGGIATQFVRFIPPRTTIWATGNYILDYEDEERGYGGLLQLLLIASERTGLPNVFIFNTEQHALGTSSRYELYLKMEGISAGIKHQLQNISSGSTNFPKLLQLLQGIKAPIRESQKIHFEIILKIDGKSVAVKFVNDTNFNKISSIIKQLSSTYFEFSVNYQHIWIPVAIRNSQPTDIGTPALIQIRSSSLISARGSVKQDNEGSTRHTELDLRYSWNGFTSLQLFCPITNKWQGVVRSRSLHVRLPFAMQLVLNFAKSVFKIIAVKHRDVVAGSRLGLVWQATISLTENEKSSISENHTLSDEWSMDSEDLGARLGASVFNCPEPTTISDALHLLKRAFMLKNKNYQMIPGGVPLLGLFSLKDQLSFQPPGANCGLILSFTPLLNHVEPVLLFEKNQLRISMTRDDGMLWEIQAGHKQLLDGNKQLTFKLYHTPSVTASQKDIWKVLHFEGAFVIPSSKAGIFHPPIPMTGYMFVSWGDSSPTLADRAAVIDLKVVTSEHSSYNSTECMKYTPTCLQSFRELSTRQTAIIQYVNLPAWLIMAAHAMFPEHIQTESKSTQVGFSIPAPFSPLNSRGLCAVNSDTVLTLDNTTVTANLGTCFTVAVADCSAHARFIVLIKKSADPKYLAAKVHFKNDIIALLPTSSGNLDVFINENTKVTNLTSDFEYGGTNTSYPIFSVSSIQGGGVEVELQNGLLIQHYSHTVVSMVPSYYRGFTCGLCGDFNSDSYKEPVEAFNQC